MTKAEFLAILEKNLEGTATDAERRFLDHFYRHQLAKSQPEWTFTEKERIRVEIFESLTRAIGEETADHYHPRRWKLATIAASIAILVAFSIGLYLMPGLPEEIPTITTSTQRGEQRTITLPDGSVVRLNAESSITVPEEFGPLESRNIQLSGEAFFDVVRDETRPFTVHSANLVTTVLGTSFNVRAYPEEETVAVTVATGKVSIQGQDTAPANAGEQVLVPGEQGLYHKLSAKIVKSAVNPEKYVAWKDGTILLEGASLEEAAETLGRWYNAEFIFVNPGLNKCTIDGKFRNDQLKNILENLRFLVGLEYRLEPGNRVIIDGQSCH